MDHLPGVKANHLIPLFPPKGYTIHEHLFNIAHMENEQIADGSKQTHLAYMAYATNPHGKGV
jgi:hypothetical protein